MLARIKILSEMKEHPRVRAPPRNSSVPARETESPLFKASVRLLTSIIGQMHANVELSYRNWDTLGGDP